MGREIRRVPPDWKHPSWKDLGAGIRDSPHPMFDESYADALEEWREEMALWQKGEHRYQRADYYDGGPSREWIGE